VHGRDGGWGGVAQVGERRAAAARMEAAHAALETALSTENVEELRRSVEAAWRGEQGRERLRARAVRVCEFDTIRGGEIAPALAHRMEAVRITQSKKQLREVGLQAARTGDRDTLCAMAVQAAAQEGVDVNTRAEAAAGEQPGDRWLLVAAEDGAAETIRALVAAGAEVNHADHEGVSALYAAVMFGHFGAIQVLLQAGAVDRADHEGVTAMHGAAWNGDVQVIKILAGRRGAEVNRADNLGATALFGAAWNGHVEAIRALVAAGAEVDHASNAGHTALYRAARHGHADVIRALVAAGAVVNHASCEVRPPERQSWDFRSFQSRVLTLEIGVWARAGVHRAARSGAERAHGGATSAAGASGGEPCSQKRVHRFVRRVPERPRGGNSSAGGGRRRPQPRGQQRLHAPFHRPSQQPRGGGAGPRGSGRHSVRRVSLLSSILTRATEVW
jgi:hypothetical protein